MVLLMLTALYSLAWRLNCGAQAATKRARLLPWRSCGRLCRPLHLHVCLASALRVAMCGTARVPEFVALNFDGGTLSCSLHARMLCS